MEEADERGETVRQPAMESARKDDEVCEKKGCILSSALLLCKLDEDEEHEDDFPEEYN